MEENNLAVPLLERKLGPPNTEGLQEKQYLWMGGGEGCDYTPLKTRMQIQTTRKLLGSGTKSEKFINYNRNHFSFEIHY